MFRFDPITLRKYWGLGNRPIDNLISIVQKKGIMVSKMQLRLNKLDAFSVWFDNKPFIFLSSDKDTNVRIRFDIAHELGHLFLHMGYLTNAELWERQDENIYHRLGSSEKEYQANEFAAAFLMPQKEYIKIMNKNIIGDKVNTSKIAEYFNVSVEAASNRGKFLGYLKW